jgi:hypothetical protein
MDGVINSYPETHIVLQHSVLETSTSSSSLSRKYRMILTIAPGVLNYAVGQLQGKGYQIVSVDTCLGSDGEYPYEYVGEPGQQDGSWTC